MIEGMFGRFGGRYVAETLMPALDELAARWAELDPAREIVVYCHTGVRSTHAALTEQRKLAAE